MTERAESGMRQGDPAPDLYLAPSSRPLLFSYASALLAGHPADIVYMDDYAPIPLQVRESLAARFPQIRLSVQRDRDAVEAFATLPAWMPQILRRNIAPCASGLLSGPADRPPDWLRSGYRNAYIYVTGPFMMKTLRHRAQSVVLREEGLGNYHSMRAGPVKALMRAALGRAPFRQWMGEETWVDRIEIARPEALPAALRKKAVAVQVFAMLDALPPEEAQRLVSAFWTGAPFAMPPRPALILTQPLAALGFMSAAEEAALYGEMAAMLTARGYSVVFKQHPQEREIRPGALPAFFPIEAWRWLHTGAQGESRFGLAVALCSAALDSGGSLFSQHQLQLVAPEVFGRQRVTGWRDRLAAALR